MGSTTASASAAVPESWALSGTVPSDAPAAIALDPCWFLPMWRDFMIDRLHSEACCPVLLATDSLASVEDGGRFLLLPGVPRSRSVTASSVASPPAVVV